MGDKEENLWLPCKRPDKWERNLKYATVLIPSNGLEFYFIILGIKI